MGQCRKTLRMPYNSSPVPLPIADLREAENWAFAAGPWNVDYSAVVAWQLHKTWTNKNTSPFSWNALWAGIDGVNHQGDTPGALLKWCGKKSCGQ
jgi:hypothetical protein